MKYTLYLAAAFILELASGAPPAGAQPLMIDQGVRAAGLWCFPLDGRPEEYVYVPAAARLATDEGGRPRFSFIRYVVNEPGEDGTAAITSATGGGVLHFLVLYETPPEAAAAAEAELRRRLDDREIVLRGPVVFSDGRYTLVSSIVGAGGESSRHVLASGRAPVLEGNRMALSFDLDPEASTLLLESFRMATPDVSLVFDMTFEGLQAAYDAELAIDWSEVRRSKSFSAGAKLYFISADVEVAIDELLRSNAIQLRSSGSDEAMEALLDRVYQKLLELMFQPVEPEEVPEDERGGLQDALTSLVGGRTSRFNVSVGYRLKDLKSEGESVLNFHHRATVERHATIAFNIGGLYARYGEDPDFFRTVNLVDPAFEQREVHVAVDGALLPELESSINNVTVTLRKRHESGATTLRELVLDRQAVEAAAGDLRMVYGWDQDRDRLAWLEYEYRTRWSFRGGGTYETDWVASDAAMIDLFAPYERRTVQVIGSADALKSAGVRAVVVRCEHPFFGETRSPQVVLRPEKGEDEQQIEVTLPLGVYEYDYLITWMLSNEPRRSAGGRDGTGVIFVDELPEG